MHEKGCVCAGADVHHEGRLSDGDDSTLHFHAKGYCNSVGWWMIENGSMRISC